MKILVVPDIHLKPDLIYRAAKVARAYNPDTIVFLGDYFDDWDTELCDYMLTINALKEFRNEFGRKSVFLWGNHEYSYIAKEPCSGYKSGAAAIIKDFIKEFPLQMAYQVDGYLFTHAGVTDTWYRKWVRENKTNKRDDCIASSMNATFGSSENPGDSMWFSIGPGRGGRDVPSPLWADEEELLSNPLQSPILVSQVVGHTPVYMICEAVRSGVIHIFTDTFSNQNQYDELILLDTDSGEIEWVKLERELKKLKEESNENE